MARSWPKGRRRRSSRTRGCSRSISRHEPRRTSGKCHSRTARRAGPGIHERRLVPRFHRPVFLDSGFAAAPRPGMTTAVMGHSRQTSSLDPLLKVEDIHTYYGKSHTLHGVSLEVGRGEVVGLLGRNGVGKSTTLKAIAGLVPPSAGRIVFEGRAITNLPSHRLARLGIGYVPEDRRIFPLLSVTENLRTGLDRYGVTAARKKQLLDKVHVYFPVLAERRNQAGGTLSGGEQQMLAIARAMMLEPKIILLDEPTEGLMPRMVTEIRQIIDMLHRENVAVLLVEQNVPLTLEVGQRIYIIEKGIVRHHALASELRVNDAVIHQYLGV